VNVDDLHDRESPVGRARRQAASPIGEHEFPIGSVSEPMLTGAPPPASE
jgi:hypothetical protein